MEGNTEGVNANISIVRHSNSSHSNVQRRRSRRRHRKNHKGIEFLKRFCLAIFVIDVSLAICESNLISTFFLFLTLSSTFEVKPENVIESYCYYQPKGNRMCEDYMQFMTSSNIPGKSHPNPNPGGGGTGNGGGGVADGTEPSSPSMVNIPNTNHLEAVVPRKLLLTEEESYELFLAYNQSLYDTPARFHLQQNLGDNCVFAKMYSKLAQQVFENHTGTQISQRNLDAIVQQMSLLFNVAPPTKQLTAPAAPTFKKDIPQVIEAARRGLIKKGQLGYQEGMDNIAFREKLRHSVDVKQSPVVVNEKFRNLIQIKDFIRHRWKRSVPTTMMATSTETSLAKPHASATPEHHRPGGIMAGSMSMSSSGKTNPGVNKTTPDTFGSDDDDDGTMIKRSDRADQPSDALSGGNAGGNTNKSTKIDGQTKAVNTENVNGRAPETRQNQVELNENETANVPQKHEKTQYKKTHTSSVDRESAASLKNFVKVHSLLEKGPRSILGLMESALYNNWKCFMDSAKSYVAPNQKNRQSDTTPTPNTKMSCEVQLGHDLEKAFILSSSRNTTIPVLGMEMNIFSPETYTKAERRKQAMIQIYHDYGSTLVGKLSSFTEMPLSRSLTSIHWVVRVYTFVWHLVICGILFHGCMNEDSTSLNIWGVLNILTSLVHFMIDDWISSTLHAQKTAVAIWFYIVYGFYKPLSLLLVSTLASEIFKNRGLHSSRGMLFRFWDLLRGRRREPRARSYERRNWIGGCPVTGHFFLITARAHCETTSEKKTEKGIKDPPLPDKKERMTVDMATVDQQGNLKMYLNSPPPEGLETGVCMLCGEESKPTTTDTAAEKDTESMKNSTVLDSKQQNLHYRCSPAEISPLAQNDSFALSDEDDEDEIEIAAEDDDDSDEEEDDDDEENPEDEQAVEGDQEQGRRPDNPTPPRLSPNDHVGPTCNNRNHHNHTVATELPSRVHLVAERGPKEGEINLASELPNASPPPAYDPNHFQLRNQVMMERSRRSVIDGLVIKPVPDRVDGLLDAPILDGEHPHM